MAKRLGAVILLMILGALGYVAGIRLGLYGKHLGPGEVTRSAVPADVVGARRTTGENAAAGIGAPRAKQVLFGDLHVHTTYSTDAFYWSLPIMQGEGPHPIADACDYARFCSALDFWSINDHAEAMTPQKWRETKQSIRQCNAVSGDAKNPDLVAFIGWEWSQVGTEPKNHYGHKNVIFRDLGEDQVPTRPIAAAGVATDGLRHGRQGIPLAVPLLDFPNRQRYYDFTEFLREAKDVPFCPPGVKSRDLGPECYDSAATPRELFDKLDQWGFDVIVIPHGTTWGFYTPPGSTLDKQLTSTQNDPAKQILFEIMSGHGNSEEYRRWREVRFDESGKAVCPEPTRDYLPSCWRAGEIIRGRCAEAGVEERECDQRAAEARQLYADAGVPGHLTVPGVKAEEWLDAGQCRDCFIPSFNYRPRNSAEYGLAISNFDGAGRPKRFQWGFIASSDNHRARPGTGYKEFDRLGTTEASGVKDEVWAKRSARPGETPAPGSRSLRPEENVIEMGFAFLEAERQASFFMTGGLAAVHSEGRSREQIWDALKRKEVYGTSGDRILLWFDLVNGADGSVPMGGTAAMRRSPQFKVRAVGASKQKPGCPQYSTRALDPSHLAKLCKGECYNPADERKLVTRIEVVRIHPQLRKDEPVDDLIQDPWRTFPCERDPAGCSIEFEESDFDASGRDAVYYVRAIEEPSPAVNAGHLRCDTDKDGNCLRVHPCYGDYRTPPSDDCLENIEERAWSSPIYVDYRAAD